MVTVGSDAHPFNRLVEAVDGWLVATSHDVEAVIQFGTSGAPAHPELWRLASPYLPFSELQSVLTEADIVVTQGGPTGITEARRLGTQPIVMPRTHERGEHVDGHQVAFCRQLARAGQITLVETTELLLQALDAALDSPSASHLAPGEDPAVAAAVDRFGVLVRDLRPRGRDRRRAERALGRVD